MRRGAAAVALLIVVGACSAGDSSNPSTEAGNTLDPAATVAAFFDMLAASDYQSTAPLIDEEQLAILTSIEGASGEEVAGMLASGVPPSVRADFWQAFASSLPALVEQTVDRATIGTARDLSAGFSSVPVGFPESRQDASWIVRDREGAWVIDLFATFGSAFGPNLAAWFGGLADGTAKDEIRAALLRGGPSLELGLEEEPLGPLDDQAEAGVRELLRSVGA